MQLMVQGDQWELYIPSDLAYGERGSPPKIPGDSALVFIIEMIEIQGEKVIALKCNPDTLEDCDDKMKTYIAKAKTKFGEDVDVLEEEIGRLKKIIAGGGIKEELKSWFDTRIFLLQQMIPSAKDELQLFMTTANGSKKGKEDLYSYHNSFVKKKQVIQSRERTDTCWI